MSLECEMEEGRREGGSGVLSSGDGCVLCFGRPAQEERSEMSDPGDGGQSRDPYVRACGC